ncbi:unnamed protein product [Effrenium voratum]|nr:unnamed protein product [Effrenium voratum]
MRSRGGCYQAAVPNGYLNSKKPSLTDSRLKSRPISISTQSTACSLSSVDLLSPSVASMMTGWRNEETVPNHVMAVEDRYLLLRKLGEGKFGTVQLAVRKGTNQRYAAKLMPHYGDLEVQITKCLSHPHIVRLHETVKCRTGLCLVLDLCLGGDLHQWIASRFRKEVGNRQTYRPPGSAEVSSFLWQILTAVAYLHHHRIVHRDIKPGNLLLVEQGSRSLKLADFNLACKFSKGHKLSSRCGSLMYLAPEVLRRAYTERCDIWGIGVTFQDLVTGEALWQGQQDQEIEKLILHSKPHLRSCHWRMQSQAARDLFLQLMLPEDQGRPSARKALESSFVSRRFGQSCCAVS